AWLITESSRVRSQLNQLRATQQSQDAEQRQLEQQIAEERARNEDLAAQLEQERKAASELAARREREQQTNPSSPDTMASLILMPGLARGDNTRAKLTISSAVRSVRLMVGVEPQD